VIAKKPVARRPRVAVARKPAAGAITWVPAARRVYERAYRPNRRIRLIVIHVAQASARSVINAFHSGGVEASAHYVVSAIGHVFHMVPDRSIAWHSGNPTYNRISIGIEHAGLVGVRSSITEPEYRASARLVAELAAKYGIPLDRRHVIGHNQVPDPFHPGRFGGADHHTDPGPYWKWAEYIRYARLYESEAAGALAVARRKQPTSDRSLADRHESQTQPQPAAPQPDQSPAALPVPNLPDALPHQAGDPPVPTVGEPPVPAVPTVPTDTAPLAPSAPVGASR
jgi:N-acetyl-anhydromuramyl-L-alanine amidase AmpD